MTYDSFKLGLSWMMKRDDQMKFFPFLSIVNEYSKKEFVQKNAGLHGMPYETSIYSHYMNSMTEEGLRGIENEEKDTTAVSSFFSDPTVNMGSCIDSCDIEMEFERFIHRLACTGEEFIIEDESLRQFFEEFADEAATDCTQFGQMEMMRRGTPERLFQSILSKSPTDENKVDDCVLNLFWNKLDAKPSLAIVNSLFLAKYRECKFIQFHHKDTNIPKPPLGSKLPNSTTFLRINQKPEMKNASSKSFSQSKDLERTIQTAIIDQNTPNEDDSMPQRLEWSSWMDSLKHYPTDVLTFTRYPQKSRLEEKIPLNATTSNANSLLAFSSSAPSKDKQQKLNSSLDLSQQTTAKSFAKHSLSPHFNKASSFSANMSKNNTSDLPFMLSVFCATVKVHKLFQKCGEEFELWKKETLAKRKEINEKRRDFMRTGLLSNEEAEKAKRIRKEKKRRILKRRRERLREMGFDVDSESGTEEEGSAAEAGEESYRKAEKSGTASRISNKVQQELDYEPEEEEEDLIEEYVSRFIENKTQESQYSADETICNDTAYKQTSCSVGLKSTSNSKQKRILSLFSGFCVPSLPFVLNTNNSDTKSFAAFFRPRGVVLSSLVSSLMLAADLKQSSYPDSSARPAFKLPFLPSEMPIVLFWLRQLAQTFLLLEYTNSVPVNDVVSEDIIILTDKGLEKRNNSDLEVKRRKKESQRRAKRASELKPVEEIEGPAEFGSAERPIIEADSSNERPQPLSLENPHSNQDGRFEAKQNLLLNAKLFERKQRTPFVSAASTPSPYPLLSSFAPGCFTLRHQLFSEEGTFSVANAIRNFGLICVEIVTGVRLDEFNCEADASEEKQNENIKNQLLREALDRLSVVDADLRAVVLACNPALSASAAFSSSSSSSSPSSSASEASELLNSEMALTAISSSSSQQSSKANATTSIDGLPSEIAQSLLEAEEERAFEQLYQSCKAQLELASPGSVTGPISGADTHQIAPKSSILEQEIEMEDMKELEIKDNLPIIGRILPAKPLIVNGQLTPSPALDVHAKFVPFSSMSPPSLPSFEDILRHPIFHHNPDVSVLEESWSSIMSRIPSMQNSA
ncbi:uncharacterized protein MONOS_7238 [Monocercomonoides exilis]|uniref:uncharacterized protein n=1 Tax=Monocercomonoides exilis TaxID=2049356 RepID=UPI003559B7B3|nr:hypothetical protein MONOS_7238 [Monocercomonoides exilis]|eukprot:MONOS_7238.1-p1 / transcript=MONOS_7238.1 / gene=MONOS_7238 / organism=Monocercomonoides_exilis_PA203 / gene_product=unspecified product / transcript_product=unspecified product / location=Mono_scaffold00242:70176-73599(+) / protein_length=1085 / sequence_SO=supercontig / SO=protein_coding / is_pseudo=false